MKFYLHHEQEPAFTAVYRVAGSQPQLRIKQLAAWFCEGFNARHGSIKLLEPQEVTVTSGPAKRELEPSAFVRKALRDGSDVYIGGKSNGPVDGEDVPNTVANAPACAGEEAAIHDNEHREDLPNPLAAQVMQRAAELEASKNYRQASHVYEELLSILSPGTLAIRLCFEKLIGLWLEVERPSQALHWGRAALQQFPQHPGILALLGDCLSHPKARKDSLPEALAAYAEAQTVAQDPSMKRKYLLSQARVLYATESASDQAMATSIVMEAIGKDQTDWESLFMYAKIASDRGMTSDALRVLLRLLVQQPNHSGVRASLAKVLKEQSDGLDCLLGELNGEAHTDAALAFLATCVKDHGAVNASISLFSRAREMKPSSSSYLLNLVHTYELNQDYQKCISLVAEFCKVFTAQADAYNALQEAASATNINALSTEAVAQVLFSLPEYASPGTGWMAAKRPTDVKVLDENHEPEKVAYTSEDLDLLAAEMTAAKVLFVGGALQHAACLVKLLQPAVQASDKALHTTLIRNEAAYLGCVQQILDLPDGPKPQSDAITLRPLYLIGDSHCLSAAWQKVVLRGKTRLVVPQLVTGCKVWHLRPDSVFYPKVAFQNTINALPKDAQVIMLLGEIDCREGLLLAVEKCKYDSLSEGIEATVMIYLDVLEHLQERGVEVFVHPIPPVLNETRHIVLPFNACLKKKLQETQSGKPKQNQIVWLDFLDDLLSSDQSCLNQELHFDGTHMSPTYVKYMARELAAIA